MQIEKPWGIKDNDIQSRSIKSWSERQQRSAEMKSQSTVRRVNSDNLFAKFIAAQVEETHMYNALYDIPSSDVLDITA